MANTSSNSIWINANNFNDWELSRPELFRNELLDLFFQYFRLNKNSKVLDAGCATGMLTRYIARGLENGDITGFDISKQFVDYGSNKIIEENFSSKARIVNEDGYNLSFADDSYDNIISHNYLAVLSDPIAGLKELIRVCKPKGSISISSTTRNRHTWKGDYPFDGVDRLEELINKFELIYREISVTKLKQSLYWTINRFPRLMHECGLKNISLHPVASGFSYNDKYWDKNFRIKKISMGINEEIRIYRDNYQDTKFEECGFTQEEFIDLISLLERKREYLVDNIYNDYSWEWTANLHYIVTGNK